MRISFQKQTENHVRSFGHQGHYSWNTNKSIAAYYRPTFGKCEKQKRCIPIEIQLFSNMMSVSIAEAIREAGQTLRQAGVPDARREAGSLLQHIIERDRT
ncbi:MAG: hypothetical protein ND895_08155, partial [Pyrinomonadaceae bacterium]|nr:hypothetical protein [Pyrinomonadaceae bacterium]